MGKKATLYAASDGLHVNPVCPFFSKKFTTSSIEVNEAPSDSPNVSHDLCFKPLTVKTPFSFGCSRWCSGSGSFAAVSMLIA
jgi:hypothetical protein